MRARFCRENIGTLSDELGRQTHRQIAWEGQIREGNPGRLPLGRGTAGQRGKQVVALGKPLLNPWDRAFGGEQLTTKTQYIRIGYRTRVELYLRQRDLLALEFDELMRGVYFRFVGGPGDHRVDNIGQQREVSGLLVCAGGVHLRMQG